MLGRAMQGRPDPAMLSACATRTSTVATSSDRAADLLRRYRERVLAAFPGRVERIVLFGSRARGEEHEESDWDFAIFLDHEPTSHDRNHLSAIDWEIGGADGDLVQSHVFSGQKWLATDEFACNIREGLIVYGPAHVPAIERPTLDHARAALAKVSRYADQAMQAPPEAYETVIRSSYYAMFYAARAALLAAKGSASTSHGPVVEAFSRMAAHRCRKDIRAHAAALKAARELWIQADYGYDDLTEAGRQLREQVSPFLDCCFKLVDQGVAKD